MSFNGHDWYTMSTTTNAATPGTVVINTPIVISGSYVGVGTTFGNYQWYPTVGTTTSNGIGFGGTSDKKIHDTGIEYIDYETVYRVKKGGTYKLFDWFIYEKMKLEGRIKEVD